MVFLYNIGIQFYYFGIRIAGFFSEKAREWQRGRQHIWQELEVKMQPLIATKKPIVWMHCVSLGEFEQGRPVIEALKTQNTDYQTVVSFFSPSGYTIRKDYSQANVVTYLPLDTAKNAQRFVEIVQPQMAIFVKYEFWWHYLNTLSQKQIPTILISAIFRERIQLFNPYNAFFLKMLRCFMHFFVQDKHSSYFLHQNGFGNYIIVGDTRVDRVREIAAQKKAFPLIAEFTKNTPTLIAGSTWGKDETILYACLQKPFFSGWKMIIAPHEIGSENIARIQRECPVSSLLYSKANTENIYQHKILIINNIGMLSSLYAYGKIAYIGGGFGKGIHNTLEPIAHGLPVIFGPKYERFVEAVELDATGGGFAVNSGADLQRVLQALIEKNQYEKAGEIAYQYIQKNSGATAKIVAYINEYFSGKNAV